MTSFKQYLKPTSNYIQTTNLRKICKKINLISIPSERRMTISIPSDHEENYYSDVSDIFKL